MQTQPTLFDKFVTGLRHETLESLRDGLIGHDAQIDGPDGVKRMVYADYVASGRALMQIETFVLRQLLPLYANSHTEASFVGAQMTRARREARDIIRSCCNASGAHAVVFTGSGATQGINRLVHLMGLPDLVASGAKPLVLIGPYEHHSNILPWRETGADVTEVAEAECGGPCLETLDRILSANAGRPIFASFSAASNVTGILSDVHAVTKRLKMAGAKVIWDYAGGGPYLPIDLCPSEDALIDAVVLSPHKFVGGPQASGVMIVRHDAVCTTKPTFPGGGTVKFVSPTSHDYSDNLEAREEAGTPNVIGDLRAALCFLVKQSIGEDWIAQRNDHNRAKLLAVWQDAPNIEILGNLSCPRLPIFSFRLKDGAGGYIHQQLVTRMLSDRYGIQARGGCACAGPYVHRLLDIGDGLSSDMRNAILAGREIEKPGFTRLNLSYLASDEDVDYIARSVAELSHSAALLQAGYHANSETAIFTPTRPGASGAS